MDLNSAVSSFTFYISISTSPILIHDNNWNVHHNVSGLRQRTETVVGETLKLICLARGSPKPKVIWKKSKNLIAKDEMLVIENLTFHHSDLYTCSAKNENGIARRTFKIDVATPPFIDNAVEIKG